MDPIWDCMNLASRIGRQTEKSDTLVPKTQSVTITPTTDLQEFTQTINLVRILLVPFVTSSKKTKTVEDPSFEICIRGLKEILNEIFLFFKDLEKEFSIHTWKTQKARIYRMDFQLKQRLDQFGSLFNGEEEKSKTDNGKKKETKPAGADIIEDAEAREVWTKAFGPMTLMVPWNVFLSAMDPYLGNAIRHDPDFTRRMMDFTRNDHVSVYEFNIFLKWFGPLKQCSQKLIDSLAVGLGGFIPAVEANLLLEGKRDGTFLVRCSKTQPGSFAVTFVDSSGKIKHCLLHHVTPFGHTLKNPPHVYNALKEFTDSHVSKLRHPLTQNGKIVVGNGEANTKGEVSSVPVPDGNACVVCMDAPTETVFLECGHLACCSGCSGKLKLCPMCRNPIVRVVHIYRAT
eukprot:TRINITY_DN913_c0_g1_i1.p1 TRINITY_DN913_c0_g1~~TRINITY_DN913_c0_g1_i1.p1  ORF type:complete len:432 (-),score=54.60 TRINITY_DN913_c0_g1_i1:108-1307(-)